MKFSLEKAKKVTKVALLTGAGIIGASAVSNSKETPVQANELKNDKNLKTEINISNVRQASRDGIYFKLVDDYTKKSKHEIAPNGDGPEGEDVVLLKSIEKLEKKFSSLSKGERNIAPGSLTIIGGSELSGFNNTDMPVFNDKYISDWVMGSVLDSVKNVKILGRDFSSFSAIDEGKKLSDEGYIDLENDYKYLQPEFYFIIDSKVVSDTAVFTLKFVSLKDKKVETIDSENFLFADIDDAGKEKTINELIIPNLTKRLKDKLAELGLDNN